MNIQTVTHKELSFLNVHTPQELEIKHLRNTYGFSQLHLEDYLSSTQVPQIEVYKDYTLAVFDFPFFDPPHTNDAQKPETHAQSDKKTTLTGILTQPLSLPFTAGGTKKRRIRTGHVNFYIGQNYLVVLHEETTPQIDEIFAQCQKSLKNREELMGQGPLFLFYKIIDVLVDSCIVSVNEISATIDYIDKQLAENRSPHVVEDISLTRRNIVVFQTMIKPALSIFTDLENGKHERLNGTMTQYWSNILDHVRKVWERLEDSRELIEGISLSNESILTFRTNEIVKFLTVITAISFPFVIVNNLYSMNVAGLPFAKEDWIVWVLFTVIFIAGCSIIVYFKIRKWL